MWIIRWVLITILVLALVGFLGLNQDELVDVNFFFWETPPIALAYALFVAFALGMVAQLLISIVSQFQLRAHISRQKRQIGRLQDELEKLRSLSIEEEILAPEDSTPGIQHQSGD
ncbi:MAG TPA: LapA family protein [Bacteroidetes bacterium]|nr:LapA family protein [Bacteroidota bacterium]